MFDYARKMKLAASDLARRASLKLAAATFILVGTGFLLAALWTFLAVNMVWGPLIASLVIGVIFLIIGLIVMLSTGRAHHEPPTTAELKAEIEERLSLATDVVLDRVTGRAERAVEKVRDSAAEAFEAAQTKVSRFAGRAGNTVHSVMDSVTYGASRMADRAEAQTESFVHRASDSAEELATKAGLTPERRARLSERVSEEVDRAKSSNLAVLVPVVGAFAVGMTLAQRLRGRTGEADDEAEDWLDEDFDDGLYDDDDIGLDFTDDFADLDEDDRRDPRNR